MVLESGGLNCVVIALVVGALVFAFVRLLVQLLVLRHDAGIGCSELAFWMRARQILGTFIGLMLPQVDLK